MASGFRTSSTSTENSSAERTAERARRKADLSGANLNSVNFEGMNLDLVNFSAANLEGASFYNTRLSSADLSKANLNKADLRKADLTEAHLSLARIARARQFGGAELFRTDLRGAILRNADFGAANLRSAEVRGADFKGATMRTTILRETNLEGVDLSGIDLSTTLMPAGLQTSQLIFAWLMGCSAGIFSDGDKIPGSQSKTTKRPADGRLVSSAMTGVREAIAKCWSAVRVSVFSRASTFSFPADDQKFLLNQQWSELRMHKNVSYRPAEGVLRGVSGDSATMERLQKIFKDYTEQVIQFAGNFLRPVQRKNGEFGFCELSSAGRRGRDLPLHKRNDFAACGCVSEPAYGWWAHRNANFYEFEIRRGRRCGTRRQRTSRRSHTEICDDRGPGENRGR